MTRPLSLSEFSPITDPRIPNGPHGGIDKHFAADIQHALEARAKADEAPTRRAADGSPNGKIGAPPPTPLPLHDASAASSPASRGGILVPFRAPRGSNPLFPDVATSGNKPPFRIPVANKPNDTGAENKTTLADQQPAGTGKMPRWGVYGQGVLSFGGDTKPRNDFRPPDPNARRDLFAQIRAGGGLFTDVTPKIRITGDANLLAKGALRDQRAEYSTVSIGGEVTGKFGLTEAKGRVERRSVWDGTFKERNFDSLYAIGSVTRQLGDPSAAPSNYKLKGAVTGAGGRSLSDAPGQNYSFGALTLRAQVARLFTEARTELRWYSDGAPVGRSVTVRGGIKLDHGKDSFMIGLEVEKQNRRGTPYDNRRVFIQYEFGRREKRF